MCLLLLSQNVLACLLMCVRNEHSILIRCGRVLLPMQSSFTRTPVSRRFHRTHRRLCTLADECLLPLSRAYAFQRCETQSLSSLIFKYAHITTTTITDDTHPSLRQCLGLCAQTTTTKNLFVMRYSVDARKKMFFKRRKLL